MINVKTYQIVNSTDKKHFTVYVEWFASSFKVLLLNPTMPPLSGEMTLEDMNFFSSELSKTGEEYLQETKDSFSGKRSEIQFFVNESELQWKTSMWTLGKILLCPVLDIQVISEILRKILSCHQDLQEQLEILQKENKNLKEKETKLTGSMEEMIKMKKNMEEDLYKKFLILLNSKKKKIRELQDKLKETGSNKESVFETRTDSEKSDEDDQKILEMSKKQEKRKSLGKNNHTNLRKATKTLDEHNIEINYKTSPQPSTSKEITDTENIFKKMKHSSPKIVKSRISFIEEESDDELFSE